METEIALDINEFFKSDPFEELFFSQKPLWHPLLCLEEWILSKSLGKNLGMVSKNSYIENPSAVSIGKNTIIEPGAYIIGPCIIGDHCIVRHGAYLRENVLIADHCLIGHDTEIKNSILFPGVKAAHFAYIGDSIIGSHVNLGAGVKCANFRMDEKEIYVRVGAKKFRTHLTKLGAIVGDETKIGCNAVLNPGTLIGKQSMFAPLCNVKGYFSEQSKIMG